MTIHIPAIVTTRDVTAQPSAVHLMNLLEALLMNAGASAAALLTDLGADLTEPHTIILEYQCLEPGDST